MRGYYPSKTEAMCRKIVSKWMENGVLVEQEYDDPNRREPAKGLFLDPSKRPT